ncbi:MAG: hypothetical protein A7316_05505 [Candidatus Altiarchaeales archaeon WOR_SM1_86-2]|nr:MAG: hypothetical protein A7316_05505 [Candidatus Altiarchaeales archaeon WOR_SM1_86-2]
MVEKSGSDHRTEIKSDERDQQYFFPRGKREAEIINKIFDNEFVKEIYIDHYPGFRRKTLFRIGGYENITHYPENVKGQTILIDSFKKYFTLKLTSKNLEIKILIRIRKWETVASLKIPLTSPVKTGIRKWRDLDGSFTTWLIISTMYTFIQFEMKEDIFEKYRKFEQTEY